MNDKKTLLIIDDNDNNTTLSYLLSCEYDIIPAHSNIDYIKGLNIEFKIISAIILNIQSPEINSLKFLNSLTKSDMFKNIPILVTSALLSQETEVNAFRMGAWDFIHLPITGEVLKYRLDNIISKSQLTAFNQLHYLDDYDKLTGIYNKTKFFHETHKMLTKNPEKEFVFIRFDIVRFKLINSYFGHDEGDKVMKFIANTLKEALKIYKLSLYGRIEADIFGICLNCNRDHHEKLIKLFKKIRSLLSSYNDSYNIVPNFGIYEIEENSMAIDKIYDYATLAANTCKGNYVYNYAFYSSKLTLDLMKEQQITNDMNTALEENQFIIYLQPKYDLKSNKVSSAEALVRWMHPTRGLIPPNDFIPIFESNGFISKLDFYVWDKVCQLLRKWIDHGKNPPPVSVNVSRVNIYNKQFLSYMSYIIKKYDLPTYMLELELTESAYTDNPDLLLNVIKELKSLGFKIHMDDFGSGYSSLNILKDLPIDVIKIDLKFLESCDHIGRAENIIAAVVRMANWLRLPVIAEGVETKLQSDMLRSIGCSYAQGYYFAKPMPVEEYENLIFNTDNVESKSLLSVPDKQILDKLWEIDNNVNHMFNNILCGIAIYELFGDNIEIIRANDKYFEIVDNDRTSTFNFNNRSIENYVHKDDLILIKKAFSHAIEFKSPIEFVYRHLNKNIGYKWIKLVINHITDSGDRHLLYGSIYDITEFKITEEISKKEMVKCKLSLKELQIAINNIDINIWEYDIINDYIIYTDSLDDNYSKIIKNAVDYYIKNGIIHKSCIDEFKQMYERLKSGEKHVFGYLIIKDIKTEIFCKKFIKYTNTYDNSGKPIKAYGFSSTLCE